MVSKDENSVAVLYDTNRSHYAAMQSQKAVSAYFTREQILPLGFAEQYVNRGMKKDYLNHPPRTSFSLSL